MTGFLVSKKVNGIKPDLQQALRKYERPNLLKAVWQLANTFIPYTILCILMYISYIAGYSYWIMLCLGILAAGLLVRIFIFFHDCAHQSFFASRTDDPRAQFSTCYMFMDTRNTIGNQTVF